MILYEYPFNESIRTMLRLEHLFDRLGQLIGRDAAVDHHFALATLFEIMDVASRADLKSDVLKELDKHKQQFNGYRGNPSISEDALDEVTAKIDHAFNRLNQLQGKAGASLNNNEWLMSIRSRISIPGGTCEFDLPAYYAWQMQPGQHRHIADRRMRAGNPLRVKQHEVTGPHRQAFVNRHDLVVEIGSVDVEHDHARVVLRGGRRNRRRAAGCERRRRSGQGQGEKNEPLIQPRSGDQ